jgi:phage-related protein
VAEGIKIGAAFIEVSADITNAERDSDRLKKKINGSSATLNIDADAGLASKRIAFAARSRTVDFNIKVNGLAAAGKALAALSGGAAVGKMLKGIGTNLAEIPANIPKIAATAVSIGAVGAAAMASLGGVLSLAGGLTTVAGAGLALPGMMAGFAIGAGVLIAALKDAPTVLSDLGPAFTGLQDSISTNFWSKAAEPIRSLTNSLLPQLKSGLGQIASDLGSAFAVAGDALKSELGDSALGEIMANVSQSIQVATGAIRPLIAAFTTLGAVGSDYLAPLAGWFVQLSEKFNAFVQGAAADGRLRGWIDGGIVGLQTLGSIVGSVVSIFGGLLNAANAAGGSGLTGLASGLSTIAGIVNGPAFQGALTTVFQGAAAGMQGLSAALAPIGAMFVALAPTISYVISLAGDLAGQALGGIAAALSQPAFADGLVDFFAGIQTGVTAILPVLPALGQVLGVVGTVAGQLAAVVGPVLGAALSVLAPIVMQILTAIQPLIPLLGSSLITIITALSPILTMVAQAFAQLMPPIIALVAPLTQIVLALIPPLMTIFAALVPVILQVVTAIVPLVTMIAGALTPAINALMPIVMTVFGAIAQIITSVMQIVTGVIQVATGLITGNWEQVWTGIQNIASGVWDTIVNLITGALAIIGSVVIAGLNAAASAVSSIFSGIASFVSSVWNNIVSFISSAISRAGSFVSSGVSSIGNFISSGFNAAVGFVQTAFNNISNAVNTGINNAVNFVRGLPGQILGALGNLGSLLYNSGASLLEGLKNGIMGAVGGVKDAIGGALQGIRNLFPFSPAKEGPFSGHGYTTYSGKALAGDFAKGILSKEGDIKNATDGLMSLASSGLSTGLNLNANANLTGSAPSAVAGSRGIMSTTNNNTFHVSIQAKDIDDIRKVTEVFNSLSQTARAGRGTATARIA